MGKKRTASKRTGSNSPRTGAPKMRPRRKANQSSSTRRGSNSSRGAGNR